MLQGFYSFCINVFYNFMTFYWKKLTKRFGIVMSGNTLITI